MPLFDKKDKSRYATFTRRSVGMGAGMTAVFAVLAGRLYQLQIRDGDQYMVEAEDNRVSERLIAPPRGQEQSRRPASLLNAQAGRAGLTCLERSRRKLCRWTAATWLSIFPGSTPGVSPAVQAIYSPRIPSERQPLPYWYFGPSSSSKTFASGE